jgi:4-amino-4-deoxy-L-arabinose transferase-like glycosyltransferase
VNQAIRFIQQTANWLSQKCWAEPVAIKGWLWTLALYVSLGCGVAIVQAGQLAPLILGLIALWVMKHESRPKNLGRPLPYRRRR